MRARCGGPVIFSEMYIPYVIAGKVLDESAQSEKGERARVYTMASPSSAQTTPAGPRTRKQSLKRGSRYYAANTAFYDGSDLPLSFSSLLNSFVTPAHEVLYLFERERAVLICVHRFKDALMRRLKLLQ
jgi:hypothetical protein